MKDLTVYVGVDPGSKGGIVAIQDRAIKRSKSLDCLTMRGQWDFLRKLVRDYGASLLCAAVEDIPPVTWGAGVSGAMKLYGSYRSLMMALVGCGIQYDVVKPRDWQNGLGIRPRKPHTKSRKVRITRGKNKGKWRVERYGGETTADWKNRLLAVAESLFPKYDISLDTSDAVLLAEYLRRKRQGTL